MKIVIDTGEKTLRVEQDEYPLFSAEAFDVLSRQWLTLGWNLEHWASFSWMGRQLLQLPDDVLRLAEAVWMLRPGVIVETGVHQGGSTLLFASLCRLAGGGRVISVDHFLQPGVREAVDKLGAGLVTLIEGDSALPETAVRVRRLIREGEPVFVFLDSDHSAAHVAAELENYAPMVTPGSYLVVADTILPALRETPNGRPEWAYDHPLAAVEAFLVRSPEFVRERRGRDFAGLSYFAEGWLRRLKSTERTD